jgi:hypothetical protein
LLEDVSKSLEAIEEGLSKNRDADTKGILLINKEMILRDRGKMNEAKEVLDSFMSSPDTTFFNYRLAEFTLASIRTWTTVVFITNKFALC